MALSVFQKQDIFAQKMLEDYKNGVISNPIYKPYFEWKLGQMAIQTITRYDALTMIKAAQEELSSLYDMHPHAYSNMDEEANDDPWQTYKGFDEDKYIVSYLEYIDDELTNILGILF